jgi:hypothetical protein
MPRKLPGSSTSCTPQPAARRAIGTSHFDSKWAIEQHIAVLGLPTTIFRPVAFYEHFNWTLPYLLSGTLMGIGLKPGCTIRYVTVDDIGGFVALAFAHPQIFLCGILRNMSMLEYKILGGENATYCRMLIAEVGGCWAKCQRIASRN